VDRVYAWDFVTVMVSILNTAGPGVGMPTRELRQILGPQDKDIAQK